MKFSLLSTALLVAVSIGAIEVAEIKNMNSGNAGKMLIEVFKSEADAQPNLIKAAFDLRNNQKARRELFAKVNGQQARNMKLDKVVVGDGITQSKLGLILSMSSDAIKVFGLDNTVNALKAYRTPIESFTNFPMEYFKKEEFLQAALRNLGESRQEIFARMSLEQFSKVMSNCPKFHNNQLTGASLNALTNLSATKVKSYVAKVSPKFLDSINQAENRVPLNKQIVQALPVNFLNEIKFSPTPEDSQFYTAEQLKAFKKAKGDKIDISQVPPKKVENLSPEVIRKSPLTPEQINKLSVSQWNDLLLKKAGCKLISENTKFANVSAMHFSAKCFGAIDPEAQAYILTRHTSLPDDILAFVTAEMVEKWASKGDSGLDILRHCSNKNVLAHIGTEVDEDSHPLTGLAPSKLAKQLKSHMSAITADQLAVMKIDKPKSLADLRKDADWVCYRDDIFEVIDHLNLNKKEKRGAEKKQGVWAALTAKDMARLTAPKYSVLAASMTKEVYDRLQPSAAIAFAPRSIAQLSFLKTFTAEQYTKFPADAFSYISTSNTGKFNILHVTDAQLPLVSSEVKNEKSYFTTVQAEEMQALGFARLALLSAGQWGDLKPAVFKAIFTKTVVPTIHAASMVRFSAAQVSQLTPEVLNALSAEQVALIGRDLTANLSGRKVLLERKSELTSEAQVAMVQSEQHAKQMSGASSYASFSVMAMAVTAGFALLL